MILGTDLLPVRYADHLITSDGMPAASFNGISGATLDSSTPITNIWDATNIRESMFLTIPIKVNIASGNEFAIEYDFGSATALPRFVIVSGIRNPVYGFEQIFTDVHFESAATLAGPWTTHTSIADTLVGDIRTLNTENILIDNGSDLGNSALRVRFECGTFTGSVDLEIGYIGFYDGQTLVQSTADEVCISEPTMQHIDANVRNVGINGTPFNVRRQDYAVHSFTIPPQNDDHSSLLFNRLQRFARFRHGGGGINTGNIDPLIFDPTVTPLHAVYYDEFNDGSDSLRQYRMSERSMMVLLDRENTFSFSNKRNIEPATEVTLRQWL